MIWCYGERNNVKNGAKLCTNAAKCHFNCIFLLNPGNVERIFMFRAEKFVKKINIRSK